LLAHIVRRLLLSLLLVLGLLSVVFALVRAVPGDPVALVMEQDLPHAERELLRQRLGLDRPLLEQYTQWLGGVLQGDLGTSLRQQRPVGEIVGEAVGPTLLLTGSALVLELGGAVLLGVWMARRRGRPGERWANLGVLALYSLPSFWLGLLAIMVFARWLGWLPVGGMAAPDAVFLPWWQRALDTAWHLVLPVLVLGLGNLAVTARLVRERLTEILAQDHVLAARALGLRERTIAWRYALRGALLPVITLLGLGLPGLLGGAVVVEEIFAWPGMGRVTIEALAARDYPVLLATTALAGVLVVVGSLLADLLYQWADPRVRLAGPERVLR